MKKISILTISHRPDDSRLFYKIAHSLSKEYQLQIIHNKTAFEDNLGSEISFHSLRAETKLSFLIKAIQYLLKNRTDLLICVEPITLIVGNILKLFKTKVIYDCHEYFAMAFKEKLDFMPQSAFHLYRFLESILIKRIDGVVSVNQQIADQHSLSNINSIVCANYPLLESERGKPLTHKWDLIYIGGISRSRGLELILSYAQRIKEQQNSLKLLLIGSFLYKSEKSYALNYIKEQQLEEVIEIKDYVSQLELQDYLLASRIGLSLLNPKTERYCYAVPLKLLEYLKFGLPVICNNFQVLEEIVKTNNAGLMIDYQVEELAKAMDTILSSESLYKELSANAKLIVYEKYNWGIEEIRLLSFIRNMIHE